MLLVAFVLALLVIAAGMKLLIYVHRETLGGFFKYTTRFIIGMGFLMLLVIFCAGVMKFAYHASKMRNNYTHKMSGYHMGHHMMMHGKGSYMNGYSGHGMMGHNECCEGNGGGYEGRSDEECHFWKSKREDEIEENHYKKDSVKKMK